MDSFLWSCADITWGQCGQFYCGCCVVTLHGGQRKKFYVAAMCWHCLGGNGTVLCGCCVLTLLGGSGDIFLWLLSTDQPYLALFCMTCHCLGVNRDICLLTSHT